MKEVLSQLTTSIRCRDVIISQIIVKGLEPSGIDHYNFIDNLFTNVASELLIKLKAHLCYYGSRKIVVIIPSKRVSIRPILNNINSHACTITTKTLMFQIFKSGLAKEYDYSVFVNSYSANTSIASDLLFNEQKNHRRNRINSLAKFYLNETSKSSKALLAKLKNGGIDFDSMPPSIRYGVLVKSVEVLKSFQLDTSILPCEHRANFDAGFNRKIITVESIPIKKDYFNYDF